MPFSFTPFIYSSRYASPRFTGKKAEKLKREKKKESDQTLASPPRPLALFCRMRANSAAENSCAPPKETWKQTCHQNTPPHAKKPAEENLKEKKKSNGEKRAAKNGQETFPPARARRSGGRSRKTPREGLPVGPARRRRGSPRP